VIGEGGSSPRIRLGLKENWRQFSLLVLVNAFVGGMVGLERTVVPLVGPQEFGLVLRTTIFSFIVTFGWFGTNCPFEGVTRNLVPET
jgi:hypothetical protein